MHKTMAGATKSKARKNFTRKKKSKKQTTLSGYVYHIVSNVSTKPFLLFSLLLAHPSHVLKQDARPCTRNPVQDTGYKAKVRITYSHTLIEYKSTN